MNLKYELELWVRKDSVKNVFPREVGLYRKKVDNIYLMFAGDVVYSALFSEWQKDNVCFDTIFIDIDEHNDQLRFEERMSILDEKKERIVKKFERYDVEQRWYFTGNGYHLYCDFGVVKFPSRYVYKEVVRKFVGDILGDDISLIDSKILGDIKRVSRLPGKRHRRTGLYSIRIDCDWDWEKCVSMSRKMLCYDIEPKCNRWLGEYLVDMSKEIKDKSFDDVKFECGLSGRIRVVPKCVEKCLMDLVSSGELSHQGRLLLASWMLICGMSIDDIVKIFKLYASDFDENKTRCQLKSIVKAGGYFYKCESLRRCGICTYDDLYKCPFYVLSEGWLKNLIRYGVLDLIAEL